MYPYPKLRTGCRYQWSADGGTRLLQDCNNRQSFRLSRPVGQLLCRLNGLTRPECNTSLSARSLYRYLYTFARHGLLARRHKNQKLLRTGKPPKGPAKRTREQDEAFARALEAMLTRK